MDSSFDIYKNDDREINSIGIAIMELHLCVVVVDDIDNEFHSCCFVAL